MRKILFAIALFLSITGSVYAFDWGYFDTSNITLPPQDIIDGSPTPLGCAYGFDNGTEYTSTSTAPWMSGYTCVGQSLDVQTAFTSGCSANLPQAVTGTCDAGFYTMYAGGQNSGAWTNPSYYSYFYWDGIIVTPTETNNTKIITITPLTGTVIATSTDFDIGAIGYVNADQWNDTYKVNIEFSNDTARYVNPKIDYTKQSWSYYISPLDFDKSATTSLNGVSLSQPIGRYTVRTTITKEKSSFFGLWSSNTVVVATTTNFILATSTGYDQLVSDVTLLTGDISTTTVQLLKDNCRIDWAGSFSLYNCLTGIISMVFVPDQAQIYKLKDKLDEVILIKFPFGYVTRMIDIALDDTATSSLPSISVTMPSGLGEFSGMNFHFAPFDYISTTTNSFLDGMIDPVTGQSVEDILTLPVQMLVFGICITIVWNDLTQPGHRRGKEENEDNNKTT